MQAYYLTDRLICTPGLRSLTQIVYAQAHIRLAYYRAEYNLFIGKLGS